MIPVPMDEAGSLVALNGICPYFTMFPLEFPLGRLREAQPSEWVIDPFCGRGTTNYAARLTGLPSIGVDSSPVAVAIAAAKVVSVSPESVVRTCRNILAKAGEPQGVPTGDFWELCYHADTLRQISIIRESLLADCRSDSRKALRALILGRLHGPVGVGSPRHFSNQMPRTYAAKPGYAVRFWRSRSMLPAKVDTLELVTSSARRYFQRVKRGEAGVIKCADSRTFDFSSVTTHAAWVITSPPYYGMRTYVPDQWLRGWFLGGPPHVSYVHSDQLRHASPQVYASELAKVWRRVARACSFGARLIIRFGAIRDRHQDPREIIHESIKMANAGWKLMTVRPAGSAALGRRQAPQFRRQLEPPIEEKDFYARLVE